MIDINEILTELSRERPVFHSEADFQHAIAWKIHLLHPGAAIRLELPFRGNDSTFHLDIGVVTQGQFIAIELKYKTRALSVEINGEQFNLTSHSAQDLGRYDVIKDIVRLEQIVAARQSATGYAILLTNDSAYWTRGYRTDPLYAAFVLEHARILQGTLAWKAGAGEGTVRGREAALALTGKYRVEWRHYSQVSNSAYGNFRSLIFQITNK